MKITNIIFYVKDVKKILSTNIVKQTLVNYYLRKLQFSYDWPIQIPYSRTWIVIGKAYSSIAGQKCFKKKFTGTVFARGKFGWYQVEDKRKNGKIENTS